MYDDLSAVYDRFIDWPARLEREIPRLQRWLGDAHRVADAACGTGRHALELSRRGFDVVGFDASDAAVSVAQRAAVESGVEAEFFTGEFGSLSELGAGLFDAVLCLGNSLPHVLTGDAMQSALADFGRLLRPGGRLLAHLRNLPRAASRFERWLPLRTHRDADGTEWLFQRLYDFLPDDIVDFHFLVFTRKPDGAWERSLHSTYLRAWSDRELRALLRHWEDVALTASIDGSAFQAEASDDIWVNARWGG